MNEKRRFLLAAAAIALVLLAALLLRVQQWNSFHVPDEATLNTMTWMLFFMVMPASMHMLPGYPPLFPYFNFFLALVYLRLLLFTGVVNFPFQFLYTALGSQFTLRAGRLVVALLGVLQVWMVYLIGRRFFGRAAGLMAALLIAVNPYLVLNSHIFKSDVPLALLLTVCLYFILAYAAEPDKLRHLFWFAFFLGLAVAAKYNSAVEVLLLLPAAWLARKNLAGRRLLRALGAVVLGGVLGFLLFAPNYLFHPVTNLRDTYTFIVNLYAGPSFYDQGSLSYLRYFQDFFASFGRVLAGVFVVGLVVAFARRRRAELLIAFYFVFYYLFQGKSSFYGNRMVLPLYSAMALLIAKTVFCDLLPLLRRRVLRHAGQALAWLLVLLLAADRSLASYRTYNLLKTTKQMDAALRYRQEHLAGFGFARENFTPIIGGDAGIWDLTELPLNMFRRRSGFNMLSTGILSEYLLKYTSNARLRRAIRERLLEYRPFHRIRKTRFSPWDGDIVFWYRPPPELRRRVWRPPPVSLPRLFYPSAAAGGTIYLPLQIYEKNPCWGRLEKGVYGVWLYSREEIAAIDFYFFAPAGAVDLEVRVNGRPRLAARVPGLGLRAARISGLRRKALHHDCLYSLEIRALSGAKSCFFCFFPVYATAGPGAVPAAATSADLDPELAPIPALFSGARTPEWMCRFYRRTGIDLSLLSQVNRRRLHENPAGIVGEWESDFFPLARGRYEIRASWEDMVPGLGPSPAPLLAVVRYDAAGTHRQTLTLRPDRGSRSAVVPLAIDAEIAFVHIATENWRGKNLLLREVWLDPDYRASIAGMRPEK